MLLSYLDKYLDKGGYPEIIVKDLDAKNYLTTLFESVLFKDIVKRYNVRYTKKLYDLAHYLITNHSNEFSYTKIKNILEFRSVHTVENYTDYLNEAYLTFQIDRFSFKLREQLRSPKKLYAYDNGMIHAIKFKTGRDIGRLLENLVAVELTKRGADLYYYKSTNGKEVDFVIKQGSEIDQLIQVCYDLGDYSTRKRELAALVKAGKELRCNNLTIYTWDSMAEETHAGSRVSFIPLWRWLIGYKQEK